MKHDLVLAGVGGQGVLSVAAILAEAARRSGLLVRQGEVHGMSQRGGAVQATLRLSDGPIDGDLVARGGADLVLGVEPVEALRYLDYLAPGGRLVTAADPYENVPDYPPIEQVLAAVRAVPGAVLVEAGELARAGRLGPDGQRGDGGGGVGVPADPGRGHRGVPGGRLRRQGGAGGRGQPACLRPGPGGGGRAVSPPAPRRRGPGGRAREALLETEAYALVRRWGSASRPTWWYPPVGRSRPSTVSAASRWWSRCWPRGWPTRPTEAGSGSCRRDPAAVAAAIAAMARDFAGEEVRGWLVAEFVPHDDAARRGVAARGAPHRRVRAGAAARPGRPRGGVAGPGDPSRGAALVCGTTACRPGHRRSAALTSGLRGGAPALAAPTTWPRWWRRVAAAWPVPAAVVEVECNPLVLTAGRAGGPRRPGPPGRVPPEPAPPRPAAQVDRLLHPRSIAVAGVSERMNPGRVILRNILGAGFPPEAVTVVKPGVAEVDGCRAVPGIAALPGTGGSRSC